MVVFAVADGATAVPGFFDFATTTGALPWPQKPARRMSARRAFWLVSDERVLSGLESQSGRD